MYTTISPVMMMDSSTWYSSALYALEELFKCNTLQFTDIFTRCPNYRHIIITGNPKLDIHARSTAWILSYAYRILGVWGYIPRILQYYKALLKWLKIGTKNKITYNFTPHDFWKLIFQQGSLCPLSLPIESPMIIMALQYRSHWIKVWLLT